MFTFLSLITSIKDYVEVVHKLIETDSNFSLNSYYDFGSVFTFIILTGKDFLQNFFTFQWFQNFWSIPTLVPDVASSLISEISIFDGSFKNTQTFLESPFSYGNQNFFIYCLEKFTIGFLNCLFLCFPTSIAHIITLRRFVMQGLEAGFLSGLGTIVGNIVWIGSILFGFRFLVIPWLSLDLFRYFLGFLLIVKYMWDSSKERRMVLEDFSKYKIFLLTFLLSFTEQTTIYPFISNLSFGSDSTLLESFPTESFSQFTFVHCCYLLGLLLGSLSLLQFTCWFWENPAFQIYMWFLSSFQITKNISSKFVNFFFLYLTMICAIANFSYFGLDYTLTKPLGFVHEDRLFEQKAFLETAFLNTKASDRNTRRNRGRHGRRERWKRRIRKYRTFDASLYDQGIYDLFTIEDLNYGFDRFWLRRKIRNHRVRFRFFPGPWMRNFKKQLSRPRLESFLGPRVEFFRILFEQAYHPEFHEFSASSSKRGFEDQKKGFLNPFKEEKTQQKNLLISQRGGIPFLSQSSAPQKDSFGQSNQKNSNKTFSGTQARENKNSEIYKTFLLLGGNQNYISWNIQGNKKQRILKERSAFRKFTRKVQTRLKKAKIESEIQNPQNFHLSIEYSKNFYNPIYSKTWKNFTGTEHQKNNSFDFSNNSPKTLFKQSEDNFYFLRFYKKLFLKNLPEKAESQTLLSTPFSFGKEKEDNKPKTHLSKKERFLERYKNFLCAPRTNSNSFIQFIQADQNTKTKGVWHANPTSFDVRSPKKDKISSAVEEKTILFSSPDSPSNSLHEKIFLRGNLSSEGAEEKPKNSVSQMPETNLSLKTGVESESIYRPMTLLHPLQFYFQKEKALKRKFQFYGVKLFRNYSVENNAPYFRVLMKRFFYHYKPSLRWERTLRVASTRRARRKSSRIPKKASIQKSTLILAEENQNFPQIKQNTLSPDITEPTHFYSLVDKRASRYRFQIYKDVLQHWYYSPLNRLLLKLDIDSFIRRQPNSYFLTKNDEKFLHLKRQLLSEYYETLRWYASMENYSTMKNQIGGTKSLSTRAYNQQFAGTLKKIRHLFNISPSFRENTVLKFDNPLYNEYKTSDSRPNSILHEELLSENFFSKREPKNSISSFLPSTNPENFINQSITILKEYLTTAAPIRQQYIENLVKEKNYWELSQFLFRGQKIRGARPLTNETDFLNQEKEFLFNKNLYARVDPYTFKDEMWISLLKKCQKKLYDQEALKNYVSLKKEKYEIQKSRHEKYLKNRFTRIKEAIFMRGFFFSVQALRVADEKKTANSEIFLNNKKGLSEFQKTEIQNFEKFSGYPSALKKAIKESILWENNSLSNSSFQTVHKIFGTNEFSTYGKKIFLEKTNLRKNQFPMYSFFDGTGAGSGEPYTNLKSLQTKRPDRKNKENLFLPLKSNSNLLGTKKQASKINHGKINSLMFSKNLHFIVKKKAIQILLTEKEMKEKFLNSQKKYKFLNIPTFLQSSSFVKQTAFFFSHLFDFVKSPEKKEKRKNFFTQRFSFLQKLHNKFFKFQKNSNYSKNKDIEFWKKRENILLKRKKLRKTLKRLRNQKARTEKILFENSDFYSPLSKEKNLKNSIRQKADKNLNDSLFSNSARSWQNYISSSSEIKEKINEHEKIFGFIPKPFIFRKGEFNQNKESVKKIGGGFQTPKFQKKRTRLRRYSSFKGRGPIKKRTLREKLKRQFRSLKKYGKNQNSEKQKERETKKAELIQFITQRNSVPDGKFLKRDEKQRRTRQIKQRAWKKKKQNFAQKRRKLRKRRRSTIAKIRVYNKKLYRILSRKEIQTWWWKTFFPHFQKTTEKTWQIQKNMQIQKQLFELSEKEIFERDEKNKILSYNKTNFSENLNQKEQNSPTNEKVFAENFSKMNSLQIGNKDYKPFAIPEALRIREKLIQQNILHFENTNKSRFFDFKGQDFVQAHKSAEKNSEKSIQYTSSPFETKVNSKEEKIKNSSEIYTKKKQNFDFQIFEKVNNTIFEIEKPQNLSNSPFLMPTNPLPFYAGWDNDLRKFILTNRLLARKNCFSCALNEKENSKSLESPLQGMNAATTLYWQVPFTTYDPDQFFALGMDGFSPIGWRNFSFKHSKQTTKPILVKNFYSFEPSGDKLKEFSQDLRFKISIQTLETKNRFTKRKTEIDKNFEYRRILKKQKRLKKHPRPPVWFPSGSLSQQVLPVHYIYVFYKRSRLPRDRYIRRRLRSSFLNNQNSRQEGSFLNNTKMIDFTLRKRTKPRRKYHRKRFSDISEKNQFFARRRKFRGFFDETETNRPSSKLFLETSLTPGTKQEKRILLAKRTKQKRKILDSKQPNENIRVRQLRRRIQRQVYRPVWRSRPRAGGFVWPGDYLRLEFVKASPLKSAAISQNKNEPVLESETSQSSTRKIRKKNRKTLQEWQIQPKRYLLEKHNLKVLKKRIEKSMNLNLS